MPRPDKVQAVEDIKAWMEGAEASFLTEFRGLSVGEQQELRRGLSAAGADYRVVKMSLAKRAADELGLDAINEWLVGPTAIAFAKGDPAAAAKALADFAKSHDALVVKAGVLSGSVLMPEQVSRLAELEPREVLLAMIAGAAKAPMAKMAGMLASFTRDAASLFGQLLEQKEQVAEPEVVEDAVEAVESAPEVVEDAVEAVEPDETEDVDTAVEMIEDTAVVAEEKE